MAPALWSYLLSHTPCLVYNGTVSAISQFSLTLSHPSGRVTLPVISMSLLSQAVLSGTQGVIACSCRRERRGCSSCWHSGRLTSQPQPYDGLLWVRACPALRVPSFSVQLIFTIGHCLLIWTVLEILTWLWTAFSSSTRLAEKRALEDAGPGLCVCSVHMQISPGS